MFLELNLKKGEQTIFSTLLKKVEFNYIPLIGGEFGQFW
jgi:hypothetical protein